MRYLIFFLLTVALAAGNGQTQPCASGSEWGAWVRASVFPVIVVFAFMSMLAKFGEHLMHSDTLARSFQTVMQVIADSAGKLGARNALIAAGMVLVSSVITLIVFTMKAGELLERLLPRHTLPLVLLAVDFLAGGAGGISYGWFSTVLGFAPYAIGALAVLLTVYGSSRVAHEASRQIARGIDLASTLPRNIAVRLRSVVENSISLPNRHAAGLLPARMARLCGMEGVGMEA